MKMIMELIHDLPCSVSLVGVVETFDVLCGLERGQNELARFSDLVRLPERGHFHTLLHVLLERDGMLTYEGAVRQPVFGVDILTEVRLDTRHESGVQQPLVRNHQGSSLRLRKAGPLGTSDNGRPVDNG